MYIDELSQLDTGEGLSSPLARRLFDHALVDAAPARGQDSKNGWPESLCSLVEDHLRNAESLSVASRDIVLLAKDALDSFLQANVTGPPLTWEPAQLIFGKGSTAVSVDKLAVLQSELRASLSIDGEAVYRLLPNVELFVFAKSLLNHASIETSEDQLLWRLRVNVWHQRLLSEVSYTLQDLIYQDLSLLEHITSADFLIERATIHSLHGFDVKARDDLSAAAEIRKFEFVLTGRLGKRTKFQEKELSQLVVLARSHDSNDPHTSNSSGAQKQPPSSAPKSLALDDDTLLESIAFSNSQAQDPNSTDEAEERIPTSLRSIEPGHQPLLQPLDSIILISTASSITNTSPEHGLTREEVLPYADRVISGGSSNWQIYTQALLVRSRIEAHKSRTAERGVLQLQALVDQIIAETTSSQPPADAEMNQTRSQSTFLPRPSADESASASERLEYIYQLASPPRWKLESELADRWVTLGALRTALEIYERLQMWAEVALCWAANEREDKARRIIRRELYNSVITTSTNKLLEDESDTDIGDYHIERTPLPPDAPRLFCILGDLEDSPNAYERAWEVSNQRYARAQRSLGKYYLAHGDPAKAAVVYAKSLKVNPQNHGTWFAKGCVELQLETWLDATQSFRRAVEIDDTDGESWSNLAVSFLKLSHAAPSDSTKSQREYVRDALIALKQAARHKRESFRIWQNMLTVSVKLDPPPYNDIILAQSRLIDILGPKEGESCIDVPIMEALLSDAIISSHNNASSSQSTNGEKSSRTGLERLTIELIEKKIAPLITASRRLWLLTAKLSIHLQHPLAALTAYEKAWRSQLNKPGWDTGLETGSKDLWHEVADATIDLLDAYESLGEKEREAGMGQGELVAKDWKFKARSAVRSVLSRAKETWEDDGQFGLLERRLRDLKSS